MKLRNKRVLKKIKDRKGDIDWALLDYIMNECGFKRNQNRFSYDRKNEDYKPAEPLIKDEKVRKAVRAWAEAVGTNSAYVEKGCYENDQFVLSNGLTEIHFGISTPEEIKSYERYTIAELCGEEEE